MKQLIYTVAKDRTERAINDSELFTYTRPSWEFYCKKYNIDFFVITDDMFPDTSPHWFRYYIFDLKPGYDRYLYVDADIIVKWNAPNIFETFKNPKKLYVVKDNSGLSWIWEGIKIYKNLFPDTDVKWDEYFNSGVMLFSKNHQNLIEGFRDFYEDNTDIIREYRERYRKGFDQNIFNYFCKYHNINLEFISERWNLFHMIRREIFFNGYFVEMGYFWHLNGLDRNKQVSLVKQLWDQVKVNYINENKLNTTES